MWVQSLGWEDPLEEGIATHPSILIQRIPWTEEPGRLQSMGCTELDMTEATQYTHTPLSVKEHLEVFIEKGKIKEVGKEKERDGKREREKQRQRERVRDKTFWHYWKVGIEIYPGHMNCVSSTAFVIARCFGLNVCIL